MKWRYCDVGPKRVYTYVLKWELLVQSFYARLSKQLCLWMSLSFCLHPFSPFIISESRYQKGQLILEERADSFIQLVLSHLLSFFPGCSCDTPSFHFTQQLQQSVHLHSVLSPVQFILSLTLFALWPHLLWQPWLKGRYAKGERWDGGKGGRKKWERLCCSWTFPWSQCNPQTSHHGALILA